ncbi:MAG: hypothetical protein U0360_04040 [Dehalococcoidia bacterium]
MLLLIDNFDSFTVNLYQYWPSWARMASRSTATTRSASRTAPRDAADHIVITGPCSPPRRYISVDLIRCLRRHRAAPRRVPGAPEHR